MDFDEIGNGAACASVGGKSSDERACFEPCRTSALGFGRISVVWTSSAGDVKSPQSSSEEVLSVTPMGVTGVAKFGPVMLLLATPSPSAFPCMMSIEISNSSFGSLTVCPPSSQ